MLKEIKHSNERESTGCAFIEDLIKYLQTRAII